MQVMVGSNLSLFQTTGVFMGLFIMMLITALLWNYLKEKHHHLYRITQLIISSLILYFLFTRDF